MERHAFRAMGTEIELLGDGGFELAEAEFHRLEAQLTRFRPESELSRLNRDGCIDASPDLLRVVELALDARERTDGRFDPTVHDALVAAGYDRTFAEVGSPAQLFPLRSTRSCSKPSSRRRHGFAHARDLLRLWNVPLIRWPCCR